jgi:NitT/TauT family transport system permease protein
MKRRAFGYCAAIVIIAAAWWALAALIDSPAFPAPDKATTAFFAALPQLWPHALTSAARIGAGMFFGVVLGMPLGIAIGRVRALDTVATPMIHLLYPIPKVVFLPVLLVLLGLGNAPKVVLIALVVFFQTIVSARDAARSVPRESVEAARVLGTSWLRQMWRVVVPQAMPGMFTALRINVATSIAILFLAESIAGDSGLGYYIVQMWGMLSYSRMFAGIIAMGTLGVAFYEALELAEKLVLRWRD